jgi:hypothetical protein
MTRKFTPRRGMSTKPETRPREGPRPGDFRVDSRDLFQRTRRRAYADDAEVLEVCAMVPPRVRWSR